MKLVYIQFLRAAAALSVVVFHAIGTGETYLRGQDTEWFGLFRHGDVGVDMFFVVSGFIMFHSCNKPNVDPWLFIAHRIRRIVPIYWVLTVAFVFVGLISPVIFRSQSWMDGGFILASFFFMSFLFDRMPIIYVGWSLEYEMLFYFLIFFFMLAVPRYIWGSIAVLFAVGVAAGTMLDPGEKTGVLMFLTRSYLLEFVYGVSVAMWLEQRRVPGIILAAILGATALVLFDNPWNSLIVAGIPASLVIWAAVMLNRRWPDIGPVGRCLGFLGDASYSLYLVQVFTIPAVFKVVLKTMPALSLDLAIALATLVTLAAGVLTYALMERPLMAVTGRLIFRQRQRAGV